MWLDIGEPEGEKVPERKESEEYQILKEFSKNFIENQKDVDPEIVELVDKHFWDLI